MVDKRKIRIMTGLAVYDKHYGRKDRLIEGHYRRDYIYKKNCWTRICIVFGFCILLGFYAMDLIFVNEIDFFTFDFVMAAKKAGFLLLALLVFYSLIGRYLYGKEYDSAERRLTSYYALIEKLDILNGRENVGKKGY